MHPDQANARKKRNTSKKGRTRVDDWFYRTQKATEMALMVLEVWGALKGKGGAEIDLNQFR